jgi:predicted RND superfamily exporter protein
MEKWIRGLSKTTALILGSVTALIIVVAYWMFGGFVGGLIPMIIMCTVLGGGVGFSAILLYKGITGYTPQEKKELQQNLNNRDTEN